MALILANYAWRLWLGNWRNCRLWSSQICAVIIMSINLVNTTLKRSKMWEMIHEKNFSLLLGVIPNSFYTIIWSRAISLKFTKCFSQCANLPSVSLLRWTVLPPGKCFNITATLSYCKLSGSRSELVWRATQGTKEFGSSRYLAANPRNEGQVLGALFPWWCLISPSLP